MTRRWLCTIASVVVVVASAVEPVPATAAAVRTPEFMNRVEDETSHRKLTDLPDDVAVCDEYFFGRQTSSSSANTPFCVNGGFCKASWVRDPDYPCECLDAYEGPHCEFEAGQEPSVCLLGCRNGGKCKIGAPSWQHYYRGKGGWTNPLDLLHCQCPEGYTGLLCEIKGTPCGNSHCHNGGTCIQTSNPDGSSNFFCDCTTAKSSDGVAKYAGQYCEVEATSFCSNATDENGSQFCVNGGTCKSQSNLGCNCQVGYVGPVCEFEDQGQEPLACNLTCMNHGICREGAKDVSNLEKYFRNITNQTAYSEDFEHCVCPRGYVGLQCEYQLDQCPGGAHACLNGGECVTVPNGDKVSYGCDCTNAQTSLTRFAGEFCEMESTQFCTTDGSKSRSGVGIDSFCTNGGKCRKLVAYFDKHPGCDCPKGFEGENCQYVATSQDSPNIVAVVAAIIAVSSILAVGALLEIKRRRGKTVLYDNVASPLPPTLDIIRSLGHDREAEYTEGPTNSTMVSLPLRKSRFTAVPVQNTEDLVIMRKTYWPNRSKRPTAVAGVINDASNPIHIFNDVELDEEEIRSSRRAYWPNDAHHDATNPIHVFEDISVRSVERSSTSNSSGSASITDSSVSSDEHKGVV